MIAGFFAMTALCVASATWSLEGEAGATVSATSVLGATGTEVGVGPLVALRLRHDQLWAETSFALTAPVRFPSLASVAGGAALELVAGYELPLDDEARIVLAAGAGLGMLGIPAVQIDTFGIEPRPAPVLMANLQFHVFDWLALELRVDVASWFNDRETYSRRSVTGGVTLSWPFAVVEKHR
jgi:hypothetical protein